jgi:calcineurin-like phosphoesterase family protein
MIAGLYDIFKHWGEKGTCWLISDTHFNDEELYIGTKKIERADADEYVKLINSKVGRKDVLVHLGDVGDLEVMKKIRGYKILIMGNHDTGVTKYKEVFDEVYTGPVQIGEKLILSHEPLECGWAFNIHGHIHSFTHRDDARHMCICPEVTRQFEPINFNQLMKSGFMSKIETQHRKTINTATKRKEKRGKKK